jgi:putative PIN family toxin of toxin-antitoxin system
MKIVLDTNVVVSAFLAPAGKPAAIIRLALRNDFDVCVDSAILAEYEEVLYRPKFAGRMSEADIRRFFQIMYDIGIVVISDPSSVGLPDESDRKFYDVYKTADATLITGNKRHYPEEKSIVTPDQFLLSLKK